MFLKRNVCMCVCVLLKNYGVQYLSIFAYLISALILLQFMGASGPNNNNNDTVSLPQSKRHSSKEVLVYKYCRKISFTSKTSKTQAWCISVGRLLTTQHA